MDLRTTLNLPDPDFTIPMKADLPKLEPAIQAKWDEGQIYHAILKAREGAETFVLHVRPIRIRPFTSARRSTRS